MTPRRVNGRGPTPEVGPMQSKRITSNCERCNAPFASWAIRPRRYCGNMCARASRVDARPLPMRLLATGQRTENGCLLWTAGCSKPGYGAIKINGCQLKVHRVSYATFVGPIPEGHQVQHLCERHYAPGDFTYRRCFEPTHLTTGEHPANMQAMTESGRVASGDRNGQKLHPDRSARGERIALAKLTANQVMLIREQAALGASWVALAKEHGVCRSAIERIVKRKTWKHVA